MSYVTDLFRAFSAKGWVDASDFPKVQFEANASISSQETNWFEKSLETVARVSGREFGEVEAFWLREAYFASALQYVHLGSPERIVLVQDDGEDHSPKRIRRNCPTAMGKKTKPRGAVRVGSPLRRAPGAPGEELYRGDIASRSFSFHTDCAQLANSASSLILSGSSSLRASRRTTSASHLLIRSIEQFSTAFGASQEV